MINEYKAGSPVDENLYWIHYRPSEIAQLFKEKHGLIVSNMFIKRILKQQGFKYRKMSKQLATGNYADRDLQFRAIFDLVLRMHLKCPVISIDCKKKERIGNLYRDGKCYTQDVFKVLDHDYSYLSQGKVIPFAIYDLLLDKGFVSVGNSSETAHFIADCLLWWWDNYGIHDYPDADKILILCDAGGGNSYRHHAFKKHMLEVAQQIGIDIIICHYPPYASKWNPIEHRLFPHIHSAMQGVVFHNYQIVKELIEKTRTSQGLSIVVRLVDKHYPTGIKTKEDEVDYERIIRHDLSPNLIYRIVA